MAAFRRKAAQLQIQLRGKPRILTGFLLSPPPRSAAAKGTMIRCMLLYVQNTTPGSNCQCLFPSLPLFRDVHPKNPHREEPPPAPGAEGGVGAGVSPHPVRKEIKNEEAVNFMWGERFTLPCFCLAVYLTIFVANRCRMAAAWARVALAVGCSWLWLLPYSSSEATAHCIDSVAQLLMLDASA